MNSRRFTASTLVLTAALATAVAVANWQADVYGLFHDTRGRRLRVLTDDRETKYLFTFNYIPANFDSLLLGNSVASQLDPTLIREVRMYNAAIGGVNGTELGIVGRNAIDHGTLSLLLVALDPKLARSHGLQAGGMDPRDRWGALGSKQLFYEYGVGLVQLIRGSLHFNEVGRFEFYDKIDSKTPADMQKFIAESLVNPHDRPTIDYDAIRDIGRLLDYARARGIRVAAFATPIYGPFYRAYEGYNTQVFALLRGLLRPGELYVDFNDGSFSDFFENAASFVDDAHLARPASRFVAETLDGALNGKRRADR